MTTYTRVLLKISGEALASANPEISSKQGIDNSMLEKIALDVKSVTQNGTQVCLVVGGGNIFRGVKGVSQHGLDRTTSDHMGMMATVINGLALQHSLESVGLESRLMSAIPMPTICESYARPRAVRHLEKGRVVVFSAGTGNPYFTTDSAAALRASEMNCNLLLKATKVRGVFTKDPVKHADATFIPYMTYDHAIEKKIQIMDATALALVRDNHIPIAVFSIYDQNGFAQVLNGQGQFTKIQENH